MRPGPGEKSVPWYQYRVLGFLWWRWHTPVANNLNALRLRGVTLIAELEELKPKLAEAEREVKQAIADVQNSTLGVVSHPFEADWAPRVPAIPDAEKAYKESITSLGKLRGLRSRASPRSVEEATASTYLPSDRLLQGFYNREKLGENYDHVIDFKPEREQQQQQGRKNRGRGQNNNQGGSNSGANSITIALPGEDNSSN